MENQRGLRGGDFNRATARQSGAQGIGERRHTATVDPYVSAMTQRAKPAVERLTAGETVFAATCNKVTATETGRAQLLE